MADKKKFNIELALTATGMRDVGQIKTILQQTAFTIAELEDKQAVLDELIRNTKRGTQEFKVYQEELARVNKTLENFEMSIQGVSLYEKAKSFVLFSNAIVGTGTAVTALANSFGVADEEAQKMLLRLQAVVLFTQTMQQLFEENKVLEGFFGRIGLEIDNIIDGVNADSAATVVNTTVTNQNTGSQNQNTKSQLGNATAITAATDATAANSAAQIRNVGFLTKLNAAIRVVMASLTGWVGLIALVVVATVGFLLQVDQLTGKFGVFFSEFKKNFFIMTDFLKITNKSARETENYALALEKLNDAKRTGLKLTDEQNKLDRISRKITNIELLEKEIETADERIKLAKEELDATTKMVNASKDLANNRVKAEGLRKLIKDESREGLVSKELAERTKLQTGLNKLDKTNINYKVDRFNLENKIKKVNDRIVELYRTDIDLTQHLNDLKETEADIETELAKIKEGGLKLTNEETIKKEILNQIIIERVELEGLLNQRRSDALSDTLTKTEKLDNLVETNLKKRISLLNQIAALETATINRKLKDLVLTDNEKVALQNEKLRIEQERKNAVESVNQEGLKAKIDFQFDSLKNSFADAMNTMTEQLRNAKTIEEKRFLQDRMNFIKQEQAMVDSAAKVEVKNKQKMIDLLNKKIELTKKEGDILKNNEAISSENLKKEERNVLINEKINLLKRERNKLTSSKNYRDEEVEVKGLKEVGMTASIQKRIEDNKKLIRSGINEVLKMFRDLKTLDIPNELFIKIEDDYFNAIKDGGEEGIKKVNLKFSEEIKKIIEKDDTLDFVQKSMEKSIVNTLFLTSQNEIIKNLSSFKVFFEQIDAAIKDSKEIVKTSRFETVKKEVPMSDDVKNKIKSINEEINKLKGSLEEKIGLVSDEEVKEIKVINDEIVVLNKELNDLTVNSGMSLDAVQEFLAASKDASKAKELADKLTRENILLEKQSAFLKSIEIEIQKLGNGDSLEYILGQVFDAAGMSFDEVMAGKIRNEDGKFSRKEFRALVKRSINIAEAFGKDEITRLENIFDFDVKSIEAQILFVEQKLKGLEIDTKKITELDPKTLEKMNTDRISILGVFKSSELNKATEENIALVTQLLTLKQELIQKEKELNGEVVKTKNATKQTKDSLKELLGEIDTPEEFKSLVSEISNLMNNLGGMFSGFLDIAIDNATKKLEKLGEELAGINEQIAASNDRLNDNTQKLASANGARRKQILQDLDSERQRLAGLQIQKEDNEKKQKEIDKARIKAEKEQQIISNITNTINQVGLAIEAVKSVFTDKTTPSILLKLAAVAATVAVVTSAVGTIKSFEDGGLLEGNSHAQGGIKGRGSFSNVEVEGGEFIVNKKSTAKYLPVLDMINKNKFENGGVLPNIGTDQSTLNRLADVEERMVMLSQRPIYVSVTDINDESSRLANVIDKTVF